MCVSWDSGHRVSCLGFRASFLFDYVGSRVIECRKSCST